MASAKPTQRERVDVMLPRIQPDTVDPAQIAPRIAAWRDAGVAGINVYNYGLMTLPMLDAVGSALRR